MTRLLHHGTAWAAAFGAACLVAVAIVGPSVVACSSTPKLVGAGGECVQATDCENGLICAPQKNGPSTCTNDLTGVQSTEPNPGKDAGEAGAKDAAYDAPSPGDTGPPADTGAPPDDAGGD